MGVGSKLSIRTGLRLVRTVLIDPGKRHARRTREHEPADAVHPTGRQDILRANHIGLEVLVPRSPYAGLGRHVEHDVAPLGRGSDGNRVSQVALRLLDAEHFESRISLPRKRADRIAALVEEAIDGPAEKTAAT